MSKKHNGHIAVVQDLPGLPPPPFNPIAALEAIKVAAKRAETMQLAAIREFEHGEPQCEDGDLPRVERIHNLLDEAASCQRLVRLSLGHVIERMAQDRQTRPHAE